MGQLVVSGAMISCSFGTAPASLNVTSQIKCLVQGKPVATIQDTAANVNIPPFGTCISMANPQVAAATAAALGVLTPCPCTPVAAGTWVPNKPNCLISGVPCLDSGSTLICAFGAGRISVGMPAQTKAVTG